MFHQEKLKTFQGIVSSSLTLVTSRVLSPPNTHTHTHTHTHKTLRIDWIMLVRNTNVEKKVSRNVFIKSGIMPQYSFKWNDNKT